jgi:hypothetical protein
MLFLDFAFHPIMLLCCLLAFTGTVIALTTLVMARRNRSAGVFVGAMVVLLGVSSLIGMVLTLPGFWWIAILPTYLGFACIRVWLGVGDHQAQFQLSTLLTLLGVTAVIIAGITMQQREHSRQQEIESRIEARRGEVQWGLDSIRGVIFYDATDSDLKELASDLERIRGLQSLQISGRQFTDAGLQHLSRLKNLRELYLQNTQVSDAGLQNLKGLDSMRTLDLMGTQVSDRGLSHLETMTSLRKVWLGGSAVTDQGCERLHNVLPDAEISN